MYNLLSVVILIEKSFKSTTYATERGNTVYTVIFGISQWVINCNALS